MSTNAAASPSRRHRTFETDPTPPLPQAMPPRVRVMRVLLAATILAASVGAVAFNDVFRALEAHLATWALAPFVTDQVGSARDLFFVWIENDTLVALQVTVECTVLIIGVPLTVLAAVALATTRIPTLRMLLAVTTMWVIVMTVNSVRLGVIGWATQTWGIDPGYQISHTFVGSVIGIAGFVAGLAALFLIMGITPRNRRQ